MKDQEENLFSISGRGPQRTITEYLTTLPKGALVALGWTLLFVVAACDYLTHTNYVLDFSPFYIAPVSFFSWFVSIRSGIALSIICVGVGFFVRLRGVSGLTAYWDAAVWLALYLTTTWLISQLKRLYEREYSLSRIDPLTRVENRRALFEAATRIKSLSDRHGFPVSIAYLDLDGFKQLNDQKGHQAGDKVLVQTAATIRKVLRPSDVIARIGGDEFAVLLPAADRETARRILSRVQIDFNRTMEASRLAVTLSIGWVSYSPPLSSVEEMLRNADKAMYAAKNRGKNRMEERRLAG